MQNKLENLKSRISGKDNKKLITERDLILIHHRFMKEYGWIPLEEFRKIPITTFFNLIKCMEIEQEETERQMKKGRGGGKKW